MSQSTPVLPPLASSLVFTTTGMSALDLGRREAMMRRPYGTASGRGPRTQVNPLMKNHYSQMRKSGEDFTTAVGFEEPRYMRTAVGSTIYRPGQKAENVYGCNIGLGQKVVEDFRITRSTGHLGLASMKGSQTLYSSTRGLLG